MELFLERLWFIAAVFWLMFAASFAAGLLLTLINWLSGN